MPKNAKLQRYRPTRFFFHIRAKYSQYMTIAQDGEYWWNNTRRRMIKK